MSAPEIWARSYAQYVAIQSTDPKLTDGLEAIKSARSENRLDYLLHWEDNDFDPIAEAIERVFRRLRW